MVGIIGPPCAPMLREPLPASPSRRGKVKGALEAIIDGFATFNLAPQNCHERYMALLEHKTDADAIRSDWEAVGDCIDDVLPPSRERRVAVAARNRRRLRQQPHTR